MTVTAEPGLAGLQARTQAELAPRLMAQLQRLNWDAERLAAHQAERLRALLARAIQGSPFHARRLGHIDPARLELADLRRLPTMTKAEMMASFDEVVTDRRLTRRRVEDHLRGGGRRAGQSRRQGDPDDHHVHAEVAGQARSGSGHHAVLDGPAEDSALRLGAERRAGVVPGPGGEGFLPADR